MLKEYEKLKYNLKKWQIKNDAAFGWGMLVTISVFVLWIVAAVLKIKSEGF